MKRIYENINLDKKFSLWHTIRSISGFLSLLIIGFLMLIGLFWYIFTTS